MSNRAWVTLATNDSYGLGALVLAHSLRRVGSAYPAVILITPSVTEAMRDRLRAVFAEVVMVDVLDSGDAAHLALLRRPELGITFTKIHCWNLTQYEKCVFLDADILVVQNCDELFEREQLSAAPDVGWPDCFNSGVFVFSPSAETFSQLITFAQERGSFDGGDQGLLNSFFSDWAHGDISKHLPFLYNVTSAAFYSYLPALKHFGQNLKIIHFIGAAKPWLQQFNFESGTVDAPEHLRGLLQLWWDIFVSLVHPQLEVSMSGVAGNLARVLPGAAGQREALDELTRRQGWEAGNIDYMGADSFENIWAKISQTLSKPRSSPPKQSPPKEVAPPPAPEQVEVQTGVVAQEPVAEQVEVAKEAVPVEAAAPGVTAPIAALTEVAAVKTPEKPTVPSPAEVPAPIEVPTTVETVAAASACPVTEAIAPADPPATLKTPVEPPVTVESVAPTAASVPVKTQEVPTPAAIPLSEKTASSDTPVQTPVVAPTLAAEKPTSVPTEVASPVPAEKKTESPVATKTAASLPVAEKLSEPEKIVVPEAKVEAPKAVKPSVDAPSPAAVPASPVAVPASPVAVPASPPAVPASPAPIPATPSAVPASPKAAPAAPAPEVKAPAAASPKAGTTPEKPSIQTSTDSPPLANTPSKEEAPAVPETKSTEEAAQETRL